jgi:dissimilatory sulfite reductase (desulfoviridin) alpha/beta subunit
MKSRTIYTKMTVEQQFELVIYDVDAITKLQNILQYEHDDTSVECVSSPKYKIITSCYTMDECNQNITTCFELLKSRVMEYKATITLSPRKNTEGKVDDIGIIKQQDISIKRLNMQTNQTNQTDNKNI